MKTLQEIDSEIKPDEIFISCDSLVDKIKLEYFIEHSGKIRLEDLEKIIYQRTKK